MDTDLRTDGDASDQSAESFLEALLVDDAELRWDPKSGKPQVTRREPKPELDRTPGSA